MSLNDWFLLASLGALGAVSYLVIYALRDEPESAARGFPWGLVGAIAVVVAASLLLNLSHR